MSINNPPAFPVLHSAGISHQGMTMRDYFAAQMVAAAYNFFWAMQSGWVPDGWRADIASESYKMADAMLKARTERS